MSTFLTPEQMGDFIADYKCQNSDLHDFSQMLRNKYAEMAVQANEGWTPVCESIGELSSDQIAMLYSDPLEFVRILKAKVWPKIEHVDSGAFAIACLDYRNVSEVEHEADSLRDYVKSLTEAMFPA